MAANGCSAAANGDDDEAARRQRMLLEAHERTGKCTYWLASKRRYCKFAATPGKRLCGNHASDGPRRVPCPVDPTHTVREADLAAHVIKCTKAKAKAAAAAAPHFKRDLNVNGDVDPNVDISSAERRRRWLTMCFGTDGRGNGAEAHDLVARIRAAHARVYKSLDARHEVDVLAPAACAPWLEDSDALHRAGLKNEPKHARQQASILGHAIAFGALPPEGSPSGDALQVAELGAGRGFLGALIARSIGPKRVRRLVLVDRGTFRLKAERELRPDRPGGAYPRSASSSGGPPAAPTVFGVCRIQCDLKDLDLRAALEAGWGRALVVGKHLCGGATDFALRAAGALGGEALCGIAIAPCCHHRCTWQAYVAREVLTECGISQDDFQLVSWMSGWANCGHGQPGEAEGTEEATEEATEGGTEGKEGEAEGGEEEGVLSRAARVAVGRECKALLDGARLLWLARRGGLATRMVKYAPIALTGENTLLLARPLNGDGGGAAAREEEDREGAQGSAQ